MESYMRENWQDILVCGIFFVALLLYVYNSFFSNKEKDLQVSQDDLNEVEEESIQVPSTISWIGSEGQVIQKWDVKNFDEPKWEDARVVVDGNLIIHGGSDNLIVLISHESFSLPTADDEIYLLEISIEKQLIYREEIFDYDWDHREIRARLVNGQMVKFGYGKSCTAILGKLTQSPFQNPSPENSQLDLLHSA